MDAVTYAVQKGKRGRAMTREEAIDCLEGLKIYLKTEHIDQEAVDMAIEALSAEAEPTTEEVRGALMRLSMCAREDCVICKYKDKCNFDFQYEESTKNMNTILDSFMRSKCAEPKHGTWTVTETYDCEVGEIPHLICSECKSEPIAWSSKRFFNYCPNCGAKMDKK